MHSILRFLLLSIFMLCHAYAEDDFLPPEQAFQAIVKRDTTDRIQLDVKIAQGYYLYRDKLTFHLDNDRQHTIAFALPPAHEKKYDETFQKNVEIYRHHIQLALNLSPEIADRVINITYQGCADKGLCYPPMHLTLQPLTLTPSNSQVEQESKRAATRPYTQHDAKSHSNEQTDYNLNLNNLWQVRDDTQRLERVLSALPTFYLILGVVLLGILLCFTPCILPMLPIISAIVLGQHAQQTKHRNLILSISYVLGMALTNTTIGIIVAIIGASLSMYIFNPWVQGTFAVLLIWMAGALCGWYEMRLIPARLEQALHHYSHHQSQRKGIYSAFVMGAFAALLIGPCVTPPLAAILLMIAHTGSVIMGALLLFSLTVGMGFPLILLALGAGQLLPRSGPWLIRVKYFLAALLLLLAGWFGWSSLPKSYQHTMLQTMHLKIAGADLPFIAITRAEELDQYLANATMPVMLDFYADWCVSCKEMELLTFKDPTVRASLKKMRLLKIDMTDNTIEHQTLLKRFELFGPPALVFFGTDGKEIFGSRVIGYQDSQKFEQHLQTTLAPLK